MKPFTKFVAFVAIVLTGLSAGVAFAHVLEWPNKVQLSAERYLLVQQTLYEGFGKALTPIELGALMSAVALVILLRKHRSAALFSLAAFACSAAALIVWQLHNGPVNEAVEAWTVNMFPADWKTYRDRWEYAHAARAGLYTLGLSALSLSTLSVRQ